MKEAATKLENELGRPAEEEEVAAAMGIDIEEYHVIRNRAAISVVSFDDLGYDAKGERRRMIDDLADADAQDALALAGLKELTRTLARAIEALPKRTSWSSPSITRMS